MSNLPTLKVLLSEIYDTSKEEKRYILRWAATKNLVIDTADRATVMGVLLGMSEICNIELIKEKSLQQSTNV